MVEDARYYAQMRAATTGMAIPNATRRIVEEITALIPPPVMAKEAVFRRRSANRLRVELRRGTAASRRKILFCYFSPLGLNRGGLFTKESAELSLLLEGKRAFITGGTRGIGAALCEVFAREGADVASATTRATTSRSKPSARSKAHGRRALSYKVSVTDRFGMKKLTRELVEAWGG